MGLKSICQPDKYKKPENVVYANENH